jgi:lantibiotic modifying enzyme
LRLYEVVPEARWLDCALSAFAYEAAVYDDEAENWPDFRSAAATQKGHRHRNFATYWCHGAPGIAVSRMLAAKVAPQLDVSLTVDAALRTTRAYLELGLQQRVANFCLCHGLAGNSDILLLAGDLSPDRGDNRDIELARQVGSFGVEQYGEDCSWPCGVGAGLNQSLMLGLAGIGHFYLRLGDPTVASVLAM